MGENETDTAEQTWLFNWTLHFFRRFFPLLNSRPVIERIYGNGMLHTRKTYKMKERTARSERYEKRRGDRCTAEFIEQVHIYILTKSFHSPYIILSVFSAREPKKKRPLPRKLTNSYLFIYISRHPIAAIICGWIRKNADDRERGGIKPCNERNSSPEIWRPGAVSIHGRWALNCRDKMFQASITKIIAGGNGLEDNTKENEIWKSSGIKGRKCAGSTWNANTSRRNREPVQTARKPA